MSHKTLDTKIIKKLEEIVGKDCVFTREIDIDPYAHDETPGLKAFPDVVVKPTCESQIQDILHLANEERIPITPRGGGTGLSGGAVPVLGGVVLSLEKMNKIIDIDTYNLMAVVESGVINGNLQREVEKFGLFYPVNPASMDSCTIGGNVAESAGGANAVRYGTTRNYVCGIKTILPTGDVVMAGGRLLKNAVDHNFIQLLLGSEGTLAVMSEIVLRLIPKPKETIVFVIPFQDIKSLLNVAHQVYSQRYIPTMIELMDRESIRLYEDFAGRKTPFGEAKAYLLLRFDGERHEDMEVILNKLGELVLEVGIENALVADTEVRQKEIWEIRQSLHEALVKRGGLMGDEDVVVPRSRVGDLLEGINVISGKYALPICVFGHLGDGNIHVNFLKKDLDESVAKESLEKALGDLFSLTVSLGGKISGEHGVGLFKKPYIPESVDKEYIRLMRGIKRVFDPNNIMNPGKIFD